MLYQSTRNTTDVKTGPQAIVAGLAAGGGLYAPEKTPVFDQAFLSELVDLDYAERAARVLSLWLPELKDQLPRMCQEAYAGFDHPAVAPVKALENNLHVLELWHGPTLAFKDMALQLMPRLLTASGKITGEERTVLILVATSGDTGKAALEGFADVDGVRICVFYPHGGVSEAQRLQMVTQTGSNTRVVAVQGNFDDAQTGVKKIFSDPACISALNEKGIVLSSANSINLGRLAPQVAYYVSAYVDMVKSGDIHMGDVIDVCVPTGNFGNILAAHYAHQMGLPLGKLVCASNQNNVLTDFINTGVYDKNRPFHLSTSPSMDILISSNLERLLFELAGRDENLVKGWMESLNKEGRYQLEGEALENLKNILWGGWASEEEVDGEIRRTFEKEGYLCDPHTAVALKVARDYQAQTGSCRPILVASTASPYKFGHAVLGALGEDNQMDDFACCDHLARLANQQVPQAIATLRTKPVLHTALCAKEDMWQALGPMKE